ncbi:hypothetical protein [Methylobacterium brachiatum]
MNTSVRIRVAVPHHATVTPRGARRPREMLFAAELAADIRVVAPQDIQPAVRVENARTAQGPHRRLDYYGYDDDLWLPLSARGYADLCLTPERAMVSLAGGTAHLGGHPNPFLSVGCRPVEAAAFADAVAIENALLRSIAADDRETCLARASRLAADLLFTEDGMVFRRSTGPFHCMRVDGPVAVARHFDPPESHEAHVLFAPERLAEAIEFGIRRNPDWARTARHAASGMEILHHGFAKDRDALNVARAVASQKLGCVFGLAMIGLDEDGRDAGRHAVDAIARLHGIGADDLPKKYYDREIRPPGVSVPSESEIVEAVETIRSFDRSFARSRVVGDDVEHAPATRRWAEFELPRIETGPPDLDPVLPTLVAQGAAA